MSKHLPSGRKATSSFIDDESPNTTLKQSQATPRYNSFLVDRTDDPFNVSGLVSKSNLIGDSIFIQENSRAVSISKTGEKLFIPLSENLDRTPRNEKYYRNMSPGDGNKVEPSSVPQQNYAQSISLQEDETSQHKKKKSKPSHRHLSQKTRLTFTPRHGGGSSHSTLGQLKPWSSATTNANAETQTNLQMGLHTPHQQQQQRSFNSQNVQQNFSSPELSAKQNPNFNKNLNKIQQMTHPFEQMQKQMALNKKLLKKSEPYTETYADLRRLISFLTFITVICWFISIYFEFEIVTDIFDYCVQAMRKWYLGNKKPKTKMELFLEFLADLYA